MLLGNQVILLANVSNLAAELLNVLLLGLNFLLHCWVILLRGRSAVSQAASRDDCACFLILFNLVHHSFPLSVSFHDFLELLRSASLVELGVEGLNPLFETAILRHFPDQVLVDLHDLDTIPGVLGLLTLQLVV